MEVSRLTFKPESKQSLHNPMLSRKQRSQLRYRHIVDYIHQYPSNKKLKISDVLAAAGYSTAQNNYTAGSAFLKSLIRRGALKWEHQPHAKYARFYVPSDSQSASEPAKPTGQPEPAADDSQSAREPEPAADDSQSARDKLAFAVRVENLAKEYAWQHNSDELRGFIQWLKR
jgi:hypothetical protein